MTTLCLADAPATILTLPRLRGDRYRATKEAVRARCEALGLSRDDTRRCVDHAAALQRRGHSGATAAAEGASMARHIAHNRAAWAPGGAA